jgi:hypothetical protein
MMRAAHSQGVTVEVCLTSNVGSGKIPSFESHPVMRMLDAGLDVCLNSDNLLLSGSEELEASPTLELCRLWDLASGSQVGAMRSGVIAVEAPKSNEAATNAFAENLVVQVVSSGAAAVFAPGLDVKAFEADAKTMIQEHRAHPSQ